MAFLDKIVSRETSERLLSAGFSQKTEKYWVNGIPHAKINGYFHTEDGPGFGMPAEGDRIVAAPDAEEVKNELKNYSIQIKSSGSLAARAIIRKEGGMTIFASEWRVNEAEAVSECWLHLRKNGGI